MTYNKDEDYCTLSPDVILGVKINYGCYIHDRHYRNERKVRHTRFQSDKNLRDYIYMRLVESDDPFELRLTIKRWKRNILFFRSNRYCWKALRKRLARPLSFVYYIVPRLLGWLVWVK